MPQPYIKIAIKRTIEINGKASLTLVGFEPWGQKYFWFSLSLNFRSLQIFMGSSQEESF